MTQLSNEEFVELEEICKIECSEEEKAKIFGSLNDFFAYIKQIEESPSQMNI